MSDSKHTPGPYYYNPRIGKIWADTNRLRQYDGNNVVVCQITAQNLPLSEADYNGMRIEQCLNACNGMKSPVEEIERLKEIEKLYNELITKNHE